jgi:cytochrome P450
MPVQSNVFKLTGGDTRKPSAESGSIDDSIAEWRTAAGFNHPESNADTAGVRCGDHSMTLQTVPSHVSADRVFEFDMYRDARIASDPHAGYSKLRDAASGLFYTPANGGHWVILDQEMLAEVVRDTEHFSSRQLHIPAIENPPVFIPLSLDPPNNIPFRQLLNPFFSAKAVAAMSADLREFAVDLIEAVAEKGECDFVEAIASRFPIGVFMRLMGLPWEKYEAFRQLEEAFVRARSSEDVAAASARIITELTTLIEMRRTHPKDDLISHLLAAKVGGQPVTTEQIQSISFLLFLGGLDTVMNVLSFGCRYVAGDAVTQKRLREDPSALEPFVDEVIRMFGTLGAVRVVVKDTERFGVRFKEGDLVLCVLPMAGWDPHKNPSASTFDVDRRSRTHLTFSTGPHVCLGQFLARSELRTLFSEWFRRIPEFSVAPGFMPAFRTAVVFQIQSLRLRWDPASRPSPGSHAGHS